MTIVYQNGPDVKFNFDYYITTHMPLIMRLYGKSISRFELRRGQPGADGAAPPYVATITIWIADGAAFDAAQKEHQAGLRADVPKFTNAVLIAQRDRIVGTQSSSPEPSAEGVRTAMVQKTPPRRGFSFEVERSATERVLAPV